MVEFQYKVIDDVPEVKRGRGRPKKLPEQRGKGRPQIYNEELGDTICAWLASGKSLTSFCSIDGNPTYPTIMKWLWKGGLWYKETFSKNYAIARQQQAQCMADQLIDIADDGKNDYMELMDKQGEKYVKMNGEYIARSRLRVDVRQWIAKNLLPKVYGDKTNLKVTDADDGPVTFVVRYENKKQVENSPVDDESAIDV